MLQWNLKSQSKMVGVSKSTKRDKSNVSLITSNKLTRNTVTPACQWAVGGLRGVGIDERRGVSREDKRRGRPEGSTTPTTHHITSPIPFLASTGEGGGGGWGVHKPWHPLKTSHWRRSFVLAQTHYPPRFRERAEPPPPPNHSHPRHHPTRMPPSHIAFHTARLKLRHSSWFVFAPTHSHLTFENTHHHHHHSQMPPPHPYAQSHIDVHTARPKPSHGAGFAFLVRAHSPPRVVQGATPLQPTTCTHPLPPVRPSALPFSRRARKPRAPGPDFRMIIIIIITLFFSVIADPIQKPANKLVVYLVMCLPNWFNLSSGIQSQQLWSISIDTTGPHEPFRRKMNCGVLEWSIRVYRHSFACILSDSI